MVVEGTRWGPEDDMVLSKVAQANLPVYLVINKVDKVQEKEQLIGHIQQLAEKHDFAHIIPVSAKQGRQVDALRDLVKQSLPPSEFFFPEDYITDRSSRFMAAEIIREKLMRFTGDELPYSTTVEIEQFKMTDNGVFRINGLILVERESQKRMIIGKGGQHLKTIGEQARLDMERLFDTRVFLELWVKVKQGWADDERALRSLGYGED